VAGRPSELRRKLLSDELSVPVVSNFFPIERYYDVADKVYDSFQAAFTNHNNLDDAYVYGKRYCAFCIEAIPQHNYYGAAKNKRLAVKHKNQVNQVLKLMETVVQKMDVEETERQRIAAEMARKEEEKKMKALLDRANRVRDTPSNNQRLPSQPANVEVGASAISKLNLLRTSTEISTQKQEEVGTSRVRHGASQGGDDRIIKRDPSGEERTGVPSSRYRLIDDSEDDDEEEKKTNHVLPPPVLPPPAVPVPGGEGGSAAPPPSYNQALAATATQRSGRYHRTFLGPVDDSSSQIVPVPPPLVPEQPQAKRRERIPMRQLQEEYRKAYVQLTKKGQIKVLPLDTYQGRVGQSTNGCTVISALVASRHLSGGGVCISDSSVGDVIDRQCGPLLREIRGKLGLGGHALIIPSDVHDHLVDKKLLDQRYFEGAAGGNVMDPKHMGEFLKLLGVGDDGKGAKRKAAATFFFHEHVISIVKYPTSAGAQYDLIDSLPNLSVGGQSRASRTRCVDIEALGTLLRWYTSRKFSESNCSYIDRNAWDDNMADLDPRVFQGFVWHVK